MKKKKIIGLVTLATVAALTLAACGGGGTGKTKDTKNKETATEDVSKFPIKTTNDGKAIDGGTLDVAVVMDTQFKGLFLWELYQDAYDSKIMGPSHESLFSSDKDFVITDDGPAKLELDQDKNTATITMQEDVKWSDGVALSAEDLIFPYEIIGHKDYTGIRFDSNFTNIVGMDEYNAGTSETISGIKKVDDKSITIEYKEMNPGMLQAGGGVWGYAAPKHTFEGVAIKDLDSSDAVRKTPVSYGPYKMSKIIPGESVEFTPNEHYYGEKPKLEKIILKAVPTASAVEALKSKLYDVTLSMPTDIFPTYKDLDGYEMLGREEMSYTYIGFKMGKWNADTSSVEMDEKAITADPELRKAMGYAVNNDQVGEKFYNGLRTNASTLIPPVFKTFHNSKAKGYSQDQDKAKKILADAGYKDKDGDGFVEDKEGNEMVLKFASMAGGETAQPLADYYMQEWEAIGIKVELATGRLIDFQAFYDKLENDDPEIDVYQGAWNTGSDPSPTALYGEASPFNYSRFQSKENTKLLKAIDSKKSFDPDFRKKAFDEWQEYAVEQAFVIPTLYRNEILPVSTRVTGLDWANDGFNYWANVGVTERTRK